IRRGGPSGGAGPREADEESAGTEQRSVSHTARLPSADRLLPSDGEAPRPQRSRRTLALAVLIPLLVVAAILGARWLAFSRAHASTDDAAVDGDVYAVSPRIGGRVLRVLVGENQPVEAGQLLIELDPRDLQAQLDQAKATRAIE